MKPIDLLLTLFAPFNPKWTFNRLNNSEYKNTITVSSITIISGILFTIQFIDRSQNTIQYALLFTLGSIANIIITGVVSAILTNRVLFVRFNISQHIAIVSVAALTLTVSPFLQFLMKIDSSISNIIQSIIFDILISMGIAIVHFKPLKKALLIGVGIFIIKSLIIMSLYGIQL